MKELIIFGLQMFFATGFVYLFCYITYFTKKKQGYLVIFFSIILLLVLYSFGLEIKNSNDYIQSVATSISGSILASIAIGFTFSTLAFQTVRTQFTSEGLDLIRSRNIENQIYTLLTCLVFVCLVTPIILADFTLLSFGILLLSVYFSVQILLFFLGICPRFAQFSRNYDEIKRYGY